jgi:hypothetical protein
MRIEAIDRIEEHAFDHKPSQYAETTEVCDVPAAGCSQAIGATVAMIHGDSVALTADDSKEVYWR